MRRILLIFFLLIVISNISQEILAQDESVLKRSVTNETEAKKDKWLGWDKFGHFFISGFLAGGSYSVYHDNFNNDRQSSIYFSSLLTLSLGVGKEVADMKKPKNIFSFKDLIFDILGISAGLLIAAN